MERLSLVTMPLDIGAIDAQIAKLQKLKELGSDPEMVELFSQFNKSVSEPEKVVPAAGPVDKVFPNMEILSAKRFVGVGVAIRQCVDAQPDWFTGYDITDTMRSNGFPFLAQNPNITVLDVLRGLVKKGVLEVRDQGGNSPKLYRRTRTESSSQGGQDEA